MPHIEAVIYKFVPMVWHFFQKCAIFAGRKKNKCV